MNLGNDTLPSFQPDTSKMENMKLSLTGCIEIVTVNKYNM